MAGTYRILVETQGSGKEWFYVQKRFLYFFWSYLHEGMDETMTAYKIGWHTLEEAQKYRQSEINWEIEKSKKKIIKRQVIEG